ncbi:hypothetical protein [Rhodopila sp.]|uniref:hypothetical protein n=1 Tax=Rhodopila sp. TaxID=2480087 RepID=UPI003D0CD641
MTKKVTTRKSDDTTTSRGTVKGHHPKPGDDVVEGGVAPAPTEGHGAPRGSASKASAEGAIEGDDTSTATVGKLEKEHAAEIGGSKTQSGRGHRKHQD